MMLHIFSGHLLSFYFCLANRVYDLIWWKIDGRLWYSIGQKCFQTKHFKIWISSYERSREMHGGWLFSEYDRANARALLQQSLDKKDRVRQMLQMLGHEPAVSSVQARQAFEGLSHFTPPCKQNILPKDEFISSKTVGSETSRHWWNLNSLTCISYVHIEYPHPHPGLLIPFPQVRAKGDNNENLSPFRDSWIFWWIVSFLIEQKHEKNTYAR